ncbi:thioredoxin domain-containing protein [Candidatus Woesearchaeota archaeon]|nr:thioredoxin domain-containing protein [Candidatus Woesearchaeota archaeon]
MNKLAKEKSSYLRNASKDPINWYAWNEEVFREAKKQDKPILLSIGGVWCHWCHVMKHESFEDKEIAEIINKEFIAIKVDRDEKPDIDKMYQTFVSNLTGQGGWPLTVFLTPDKKPFFGGTYFPKEPKYGMPSFKLLLIQISESYKKDKANLNKNAENVVKAINESLKFQPIKEDLNLEIIENALINIKNNFDPVNGGFGFRPKFFSIEILDLLFSLYYESKDKEIWNIIDLSLRKMARGGIYDQLQGGFHRYSTDESWLISHFEKMLYDNAPLLSLYIKAYQISKDEFFKKIALELINFLIKEMYDKGFYTSIDADTDNEEGKYYTWTKQEIDKILGEDSKMFCLYYGIEDYGNFEHGKNVLYVKNEIEDIADVLKIDVDKVKDVLKKAKEKILEERQKRKKPFVDKNKFTNWNCMAASSFILAYNVFQDKRYLDIAITIVNEVLKNYRDKLYHYYDVEGTLDDYVFMIRALIDLHQTTFDKKYLDKAIEINNKLIDLFWGDGFYYTEKEKEVLFNEKPFVDLSAPAGNSIAIENLLRLYYLTENNKYKEKAEITLKIFYDKIQKELMYSASYLNSLIFFIKGPIEIVVFGDFINEINKRFIPRKIIYKEGMKLRILKGKNKIGEKTIYICNNNTCSSPITKEEELDKYV